MVISEVHVVVVIIIVVVVVFLSLFTPIVAFIDDGLCERARLMIDAVLLMTTTPFLCY